MFLLYLVFQAFFSFLLLCCLDGYNCHVNFTNAKVVMDLPEYVSMFASNTLYACIYFICILYIYERCNGVNFEKVNL